MVPRRVPPSSPIRRQCRTAAAWRRRQAWPGADAGAHSRSLAAAGIILNTAGRINQCCIERQPAEPLRYESQALLALAANVGHQSCVMPVQASIAGPAQRGAPEGQSRNARQ